MMSLWDALRMNMMISYQELVRTFPSFIAVYILPVHFCLQSCLLSQRQEKTKVAILT